MDANAVNAVIDHLAEKMAVPSAKLMELMPLMGVKSVAALGLAIVALLIAVALMLWGLHNDKDGVIAITFLVEITSGIAVVTLLSDVVLWLYSPEAWALGYILSKF